MWTDNICIWDPTFVSLTYTYNPMALSDGSYDKLPEEKKDFDVIPRCISAKC